MNKGFAVFWHELGGHLPYSIFATAAGIILAGIMLYVTIVASGTQAPCDHESCHIEAHEHERATDAATQPDIEDEHAEEAAGAHDHDAHNEVAPAAEIMGHASHVVFHVFHPIHMLFSAIATTAMFWRYERKVFKAILTGLIGALGVCSVSDVIMPYLSGLLLGAHDMTFHWCLIQHPMLVLPFAVTGVGVGMLCAETVQRSTYFSHAAHVFVSSAASIFYLVSFGFTQWPSQLGSVFILMVLAVTIPCCFSDVIFPLLVTSKESLAKGGCPHHHH